MIKTNLTGVYPFIKKNDLEGIWTDKALEALKKLLSGSGAGSEFTGWLKLPESALNAGLSHIKQAAEKITNDSDLLLVVGIGGSYLGARAVTELLKPDYSGKSGETKLVFAGNGLSGAYLDRVIKNLDNKDFSICVISKSGTTTEPAIAFRILKEQLEKRYGKASKDRIYAITDAKKGALHDMAQSNSYTMFEIPPDVGGRYSVLTPVGLLPIAAAGVDIEALLSGAALAQKDFTQENCGNQALTYAAARQALYGYGRNMEVLSFWEPEYRYLGEWWKQLYGESEGKDGKGIFPASLELTADLHSMGQYMQQGERLMFETFLWSAQTAEGITVPYDEEDKDKLNYLAGKSIDYVNRVALDATKQAHIDGAVPCIEVETGTLDAFMLGELLYFFEISCAVSGYISGVNPFDQPGVEAYKTNMFKMLGKNA